MSNIDVWFVSQFPLEINSRKHLQCFNVVCFCYLFLICGCQTYPFAMWNENLEEIFFSSIRFVDSALRKRLGKRKMKWKRKTNTQFKANIGNRICTDDIEWMSGADLVFWGKKFKRIFRTKFDIRYNQKDIKWNRFEMVESSIDGWRWWCNHPIGKEPSIFFICWHRWLPVCTCFK